MKRCIMVLLLALVMSMGVPAAVSAAVTYPVYVQGEVVAQAVERGGVTYLPMRTLFENYSASVDWNGAAREITAVRLDGAELRLDMRKNTAVLMAQGKTSPLDMPQKGFIQNGVTYLPLRFVAENLRCQVEWDNYDKTIEVQNLLQSFTDEQGQAYLVDVGNGSFYRGLGSSAVYLANCGIADLAAKKDGYAGLDLSVDDYSLPRDWQVSLTSKGNYLLSCEYWLWGGLTHTIKFASYVSPRSGMTFYNADDDRVFCQQVGDTVCLTNWDDKLIVIDETAGQIKQYDLLAMLADAAVDEPITSVTVLAVDGDYVFFRSNFRLNLLMFNLTDKRLVDLRDELITDAVITQVGIPADDPGWGKDFAPNKYMLELGPFFGEPRLADGVLYVDLYAKNNTVVVPLEYRYMDSEAGPVSFNGKQLCCMVKEDGFGMGRQRYLYDNVAQIYNALTAGQVREVAEPQTGHGPQFIPYDYYVLTEYLHFYQNVPSANYDMSSASAELSYELYRMYEGKPEFGDDSRNLLYDVNADRWYVFQAEQYDKLLNLPAVGELLR